MLNAPLFGAAIAKHKYGAKPVKKGQRADGLKFDSQAEAKRYDELRLMERAGEIEPGSIRTQVRYALAVNGVHVTAYIADFVYRRAGGADVVEDVKGVRTEAYRLKRALMAAVHGIEIQEIGRQRGKKHRRRP